MSLTLILNLFSLLHWCFRFQPAGNFFAALDDSGDEGAKPKATQPKKKETAKKAVPTQPAKKNDDGKRYVSSTIAY